MDKWLTQRLTKARKNSERWLDLAGDIEALWEEFFDPRLDRLTGLRSTWTCATEDLAKQLALLGATFSLRYPSASDRRISIAWRRWELQYKDVEEMLRLAFRRNFGLVDCRWIPLFAPEDKPYGFHFEPSNGLVSEAEKYIPPEGYYLTSRGMLGANFASLMQRRWTKAEFHSVADSLIREIKPVHILFDGFFYYILHHVDFKDTVTFWNGVARNWETDFSVVYARYDITAADVWQTDRNTIAAHGEVIRDWKCNFLDPLHWRLDMFFPADLAHRYGFPVLDLPRPGIEGDICVFGTALHETERRHVVQVPGEILKMRPAARERRHVYVRRENIAQIGRSAADMSINWQAAFDDGSDKIRSKYAHYDDCPADWIPCDMRIEA